MIGRVAFALIAASSSVGVAAEPIAGTWQGEASSDLWPTFLRLEIGEGPNAKATLLVLGQKVDLGPINNPDVLDVKLGDDPGDLHVHGQAEQGHLRGTLTESGKMFRFDLQRVPTYPPTTDRIVGWSRDLSAIRDQLLMFDRSFSPAEKARARRLIEQLRSDLPRLNDDQVLLRIAGIAASANNAHTRLYFLRNRTEVRRLPIRAWWFGKELRVIRAAPAYAAYLGCRIDRVGKLPAAAAKSKVDGLFAGSPTWQTYMSTYSLTSGNVLHGEGITDVAEAIPYRFGGCKAAGTHLIPSLPLARSTKPLESWWDLAPSYAGVPDDWQQVLGGASAKVPLYLRHPERNYWFRAGRGDEPFYIQYNRAADAPEQPMSEFAKQAGSAIVAARPHAIVVDVRFNTGGNGSLTAALVDAVKRAPRTTRVYVVTGRATFSAGIVAAAQLRQARQVKIVGEPVGDALDFWAEGGNIILPWSGLYVHFANGAHSLSRRPCPTKDYCDDLNIASLAPDILAPLSWAAYRANRDPALEAIDRDLRRAAKTKGVQRTRS